MNIRVIQIGTWDMSRYPLKEVTNEIAESSIRAIDVIIVDDSGAVYSKLNAFNDPNIEGGVMFIQAGIIRLERRSNGMFDNFTYSGDNNRGFVTIFYE